MYKWCVVKHCSNSNTKTPEKVFISVPKKPAIRKKWLELAGRNVDVIMADATLFFCEDHFDPDINLTNYYQNNIMGSDLKKYRLMPSKFLCQQDQEKVMCDAGTSWPVVNKHRRPQLNIQSTATVQDTIRKTPLQKGTGDKSDKTSTRIVGTSPKKGQSKDYSKTQMKHKQTEVTIVIEDDPELDGLNGALTKPTLELEDTERLALHEGFRCNECGAEIRGFRYSCVQCPDYDLCAACERDRKHFQHYMLRIPKPKSYSEIQPVLDEIRDKLGIVMKTTANVARTRFRPPDPLPGDINFVDVLQGKPSLAERVILPQESTQSLQEQKYARTHTQVDIRRNQPVKNYGNRSSFGMAGNSIKQSPSQRRSPKTQIVTPTLKTNTKKAPKRELVVSLPRLDLSHLKNKKIKIVDIEPVKEPIAIPLPQNVEKKVFVLKSKNFEEFRKNAEKLKLMVEPALQASRSNSRVSFEIEDKTQNRET